MALTAYEERVWREIEIELSARSWWGRLAAVAGAHQDATVIVISVFASLVAVVCLETAIVQAVAGAAAALIIAGVVFAVRREPRCPRQDSNLRRPA